MWWQRWCAGGLFIRLDKGMRYGEEKGCFNRCIGLCGGADVAGIAREVRSDVVGCEDDQPRGR